MSFKTTLYSGVSAFTAKMRVRPAPDRVACARNETLLSSLSPNISALQKRVTNWRVSPITGQLEQRSNFAESDEPHSRPSTLLLQH